MVVPLPATRSAGRPAVAARASTRAYHLLDGRSRSRRARLVAMRGSVALRVRDHIARSRSPPFASLDSIVIISPQVLCRDTRLFLFARRHFALRISESEDRRNQDGAPAKVPTRFIRTRVPGYAGNRGDDDAETVLWWRRPRPPTAACGLWFKCFRTALVQPECSPS